MGARRYRAARLVGLDSAPAIVADFIVSRLESGEKQTDIARKLGKPRDWVSRFAAIPKMPGFLQGKLHTCSIRAVYELYQAWRAQPEAIEQICSTQGSFTDAQARRIAHELRDPSFTSALSASGDIPSSAPAIESSRPNVPRSAQNERHQTSARARSPHEQRRSKCAVSILVQHGDRAGRLLTDGPANKGIRFAAVHFFETGQTEEVPVSELRIEQIAPC